jgi:hypothetical protein
MRRALTPLLPEDHRSIERRSCKRRDSNERPNYQNVSFSLSSAASFFEWSQSHCFSLLRLAFPFLTLFYGNGGTKFPKKAERRLSLCPQGAQLEGGNTENRGISVTTNGPTTNDLLKSNAPLFSPSVSEKRTRLAGPSSGKTHSSSRSGRRHPRIPAVHS